MNTNPYDPPRPVDEPRRVWRYVLLAAALLILCFIGLVLLRFLTWNEGNAVPMPDYEVYESMSAE